MERRTIAVRGIVQGVGFRPFVHGLACRLGLAGFVRNETGGVRIEVEGAPLSLDRFLAELAVHPPPLAQIEHLSWQPAPLRGDSSFHIDASEKGTGPVFFSPDVATCPDCLAELFDPADRRYRYPFLNCTNCGPRLTIVRGAPYDRERTTMAEFRLCPACQAEYDDPTNRRFHAQPTACPLCGPRLSLLDAKGQPIAIADPLAHFAETLRAGKIGALKGLGGYHLACAARDQAAVAELRRRKHRDEKPFALMVPDLATAEALCEVEPGERELLLSPQAPIVLLRRRNVPLAGAVAPGNPFLGVMLPYTPLHHLLMHDLGFPLVLTSGNRADEPIAYHDEEAVGHLAGIADHFLIHDRSIQVRCDDSVTRIVAGAELPIRRSRGYAPRPVMLPLACPVPILATGGQLKGTFTLGRGTAAFLSHHLGDLDDYRAYRAFVCDIALYEQLFDVKPACLAHDLHPDYRTTQYARERAEREGLALVAVQHHHAHLASCLAEHGLIGPAIGVAFDGTGYGPDGAVWGGEFLVGDLLSFRRAAHLRYVGMPGGEQAIREPWRMAVAQLADAGTSCSTLTARIPDSARRLLEQMLAQRLNTPWTSSAGRLFDAVASLAGVRDRVGHEGQAAIELEWLALSVPPDGVYPFEVISPADSTDPLVVDTRPLIRAIAGDVERGVTTARIARRFHSTLVEMIAVVCGRIRRETGLETVALSGGVFLNALLTQEVTTRLQEEGFQPQRHRLVPPNDGGLSLGQLAIAARQMASIDKM